MNNTRTTLAMFAVFMAASLVVGTLATTQSTQSTFAYSPKKDDKRDGKDGGNGNGNTVTIQKCKQAATQSGFDNNQGQECENLICTHPGENATCVQEGVVTPTPTTPTTIGVSGQGDGRNFCPGTTESLPASITFSVLKSGSAAAQGQFQITVQNPSAGPFIKSGTLDNVQITGNSFTATGAELSQEPVALKCNVFTPGTSATITGQCGTGVTIEFATADGEHATFTNANVQCTTT
jgi:hypothetical protein